MAAAAQSVLEAWKELVDEKHPTNWVIYYMDSSKKLTLQFKGDKGLEEMKGKFDEKEIQFAAIRVVGVDQRQNVTSRRPKYIRITYIGAQVPAMKKSNSLRLKGEIDKLMNGAAISMQFSDCGAPPAELTLKSICKSLLAAGGAHKPIFYECGGEEGEKITIEELYT